MTKLTCIAADLTVRQVATASPACAALLERYPNSRWAGRWTLQELAPFAHACGVDEASLLRELADAAGVAVQRRAKRSRGGSPIPLIFAAISLGITVGAGWGVGLLLRIALAVDYGTVPGASIHVHGLAQLWGWMSLFIFAVASHLLRQNSKRPAPVWLQYVAGVAVIAAVGIFFAGLFGAVRRALPQVDVLASGLLVAAASSFGISAVWSLWGRGQKPLLWHGFVLAMIGWLWIWAGADLHLRVRYASEIVLPDAARSVLIVLPVLGFATNAIYGFGIRLIPGLLNIGRLHPRCFATTLAAHNLGLCLLLTPQRILQAVGAALMLGGSIAYVIGLNGLRSNPSRPIFGVDRRGHILIRVAFVWLVVGLTMIFVQQLFPGLPHAFSGAWRHALTVGFITTMILGVAQRIVPVFIKQRLASTRLMLIGAALIIVGNAARVALELATLDKRPWTFRAMGITGVLELTALMLFGLNLLLTVLARRRVHSAERPLTSDARVREVVNVFPEIQQRLGEIGVTMFDESPFIAPSLTFGALALAWGWRPDELLARLRADCAATSRIESTPIIIR